MDCCCELCMKEAVWNTEHGTCYRCVHQLPCQIADDNGRPCCTVLDLVVTQISKATPSQAEMDQESRSS